MQPSEAMYSLMQTITKRYAEDGYIYLGDVSDIRQAECSLKETEPKGWVSTYFYRRDSRIDRLRLPFEPFMFYSGEAEAVNISLVCNCSPHVARSR